jgi:glycosyltransferase involved in cell wall biosynthesis
VTFCGFIDKPHDFMAKADIFALTSEWEGFGYVLTEAMLEKKAVVAFDISSNPEIISNGHNGFLVKWNDTEAFANALQKLIDDENMRKTFGENGFCTVLDKFDFNTNREKVEAFICN